VYQGAINLNGHVVKRGELVRLAADGALELSSDEAAGVIILAGQPINEPIAQYGPFVMNTQQEIEQAITDYQRGQLSA
jgi:redox-sensitive bicupin YhaK (pirin superfamily)